MNIRVLFKRNTAFKAVLSIALISLLVGCKQTQWFSKKVKPDLNFEVAEEYQYASIQVDVVGITQSELRPWSNKSIDDYLSPGDRASEHILKKTFTFSVDDNSNKTFAADDELWELWNKREIKYIVIVADLPGSHQDQIGNADKRRLILPLESDNWKLTKERAITIALTAEGLVPNPVPVSLQEAYPIAISE